MSPVDRLASSCIASQNRQRRQGLSPVRGEPRVVVSGMARRRLAPIGIARAPGLRIGHLVEPRLRVAQWPELPFG